LVKVACSASSRAEKCDDREMSLKMSPNNVHNIHIFVWNRPVS